MSNIDFPSPYYRSMQKKYDKARFDCFKEYLGCQNADDVYKVITTYDGIARYNGIIDAINSKIAAYTGCSYSEFRNAEQWRTPQDESEELLEYIRKRWDEIYNDEPDVDQKTADANPVSQTPADSETFDTGHFPIGSAVRLIALEQENVALRKELGQLKEVVSVMLSLVGQSIPLLSQYYGQRVPTDEAAEKLLHGLWEWAEGNGIEFFRFDLSVDGGLKILKDEEDKHEQTNERTDPSQSV